MSDRDVRRCRTCGGWRYRATYLPCQSAGCPPQPRREWVRQVGWVT